MKEEKEPFDFNAFEAEAIKRLQQGKALEGKDGVLAPPANASILLVPHKSEFTNKKPHRFISR